MSKRPVQKHLYRVLLLSLIVVLMGGGAAFLYQVHLGSTSGHASADDVVGPPTVPGYYVDEIFRRVGSPMVGTGPAVEAASRKYNIDDAFALAVFWTETNDGAAGVGLADNNPGSVRGSTGYPSAYDGYTIYPSFTAAVNYWFYMLKRVYIDRGLTSVYAIAHPYVGTSTSNLWADKVVALIEKYHAEAPPMPTPTPTPTATTPPNIVRNGQEIIQRAELNPSAPAQKPKVVQTPPVTKPPSGLSGPVKQLLVTFDLLSALVLGLWGWRTNRRYASQTKLSKLLESDFPEQFRTGVLQPVSLFNSYTGGLSETEMLAMSALDTETLSVVKPMISSQLGFDHLNQLPTQANMFTLKAHSLPSRRTSVLSPLPDSDWNQPQPVDTGTGSSRSTGLLSRYREMRQEQS
jgi:hypothetical protein